MSETPALLLDDVHKSFGKHEVLKGIDLDVAEHEVVCLIGASGSGKSTLLRLLAGFLRPQAGAIRVAGEDVTRVPPWKRDIVGVQPSDVPPPRLLQPSIQRARETELRLVSDDAQARVTNPGDDIRRGIGRAVVDHHELEIGDGLPEDALEGCAHVGLAVVDGQEHRDERRGRHVP